MILECPNCATCYETPAVLPEEGRKVKCARCAHVWHAMPAEEPEPEPEVEEEESIQEELAAFAAAEEEEDDLGFRKAEEEEKPEPAPDFDLVAQTPPDFEKSTLVEEKFQALEDQQSFGASEAWEAEPEVEFGAIEEQIEKPEPVEKDPFDEAYEEQTRRAAERIPDIPIPPTMVVVKKENPGYAIAGWGAFLSLVIATMVSSYVFRVEIVRYLPTSYHIYAALGMDVNVRGLKFEAVDYKWDTEAGRPVLKVIGEIVNITNRTINVPTVVFAFRDKNGAELYHWPKEIETREIPARHQLPFSFQLESPSKLVHSVELRFAKDGRNGG